MPDTLLVDTLLNDAVLNEQRLRSLEDGGTSMEELA
jgi:hypothetical protein